MSPPAARTATTRRPRFDRPVERWRSNSLPSVATCVRSRDRLAAGGTSVCADTATPRRSLVDLYCSLVSPGPRRITPRRDTPSMRSTRPATRPFDAHYDDYSSSRSSSSTRMVASSPPSARRSGRRASNPRLFCGAWSPRSAPPGRVAILLRATATTPPEVLELVRGERPRLRARLAPTRTLKRHVAAWRRAPRPASRPLRAAARSAASHGIPRRQAGTSSRVRRIVAASRPAARHRYPLHRHQPRPRQRPLAIPGPLLAGADRRKTTSRPGNRTSPPTGPRVPRPPPTSSACSCTPAPTGCCGACER